MTDLLAIPLSDVKAGVVNGSQEVSHSTRHRVVPTTREGL